ncbi:hypothetical protein [Mammaliicoccus stepanovicii]|nr:hypothetical protein [Mammaliicoccus stepanovicii]GGI41571.1 hypothetical protein GCM10010896_14100 [Mammaliicoccus stepanovicii]
MKLRISLGTIGMSRILLWMLSLFADIKESANTQNSENDVSIKNERDNKF